MKKLISHYISNYRYTPILIAFIALGALSMALISQYFFGLHPCNLCIIQRYPYGIVIALGLIAFALSFTYKKSSVFLMTVISLSFFANTAIALYHSGVERHWWQSVLEGCSVPDLSGDIDELMSKIENTTDIARCDEIPWADPLLGLSMANYNVFFCFILGCVAFISARKISKKLHIPALD